MRILGKVGEGIGLGLRYALQNCLASPGWAAWGVGIIAMVLPYARCGVWL